MALSTTHFELTKSGCSLKYFFFETKLLFCRKSMWEISICSWFYKTFFRGKSRKSRFSPKLKHNRYIGILKNLPSCFRLSYNRLPAVRSNTFNGLIRLQTIVLAGNLISEIEVEAFKHLPKLSTLSVTSNRISTIAHRAFVQLDNLQKLELQFNFLREFSLQGSVL